MDASSDPSVENDYQPFVVNKCFSYYQDTVQFANEMNMFPFLDKKMQYDFLFHTIRKRKRYGVKWVKPEVNEDVALIIQLFKYNRDKAEKVVKMLGPDKMQQIRVALDSGGVIKQRGK